MGKLHRKPLGFAQAAKKAVCVALGAVVFSSSFAARLNAARTDFKLSEQDKKYLEQLKKDTWNYIDAFMAPETGFPYDSNTKGEMTNTTNIGLYLACLSVASQLGYTDKAHALARANKILDSLDKIENWKRLYNNWLSAKGKTKADPGQSNISDYNKLPAGIIMLRQAFPELKDRCDNFLQEIPWEKFYKSDTNEMNYAFDVVEKRASQPVYINRGEDKLLGAFLCVASGKVPAEMWDHHGLNVEKMYGLEYFAPGWQGGGLFMQYICGLFLDETATKLGYSSANFAFAQILHSQKAGTRVWGWSACADPNGGYLGMGALVDEVVTPHASVLAIGYFPEETIRNLKLLEGMGARPVYSEGGKKYAYGFRDSVNIKTGKVFDNYLVLDQAMLFLSLANYLDNDIVRRTFAKDDMVKYGLSALTEYRVSKKQKADFNKYLAGLRVNECGIIIEYGSLKNKYQPGDVLTAKLSCSNFTGTNYQGCTLKWEIVKENTGAVLASGNGAVNLNIGEIKEAAAVKYVISKKSGEAGNITLKIKLLDASDKVIGSRADNILIDNVFDLSGKWSFKTGDDVSWVKPAYNDAGWGKIDVPAYWEDNGYKDYNGIATYRTHFKVSVEKLKSWANKKLLLQVGGIDNADEIYFNGRKIGASSSGARFYPIPKALLRAEEDNVIAVRVHNSAGSGGISAGPVCILPLQEYMITQGLVKPMASAQYSDKIPSMDGPEWNNTDAILLDEKALELGQIQNSNDLRAKGSFLWNKQYLFLKLDVVDNVVSAPYTGEAIYKGDGLEFYVDPDGTGLVWGDPAYFQIGITPPNAEGKSQTYAWFQKKAPNADEVKANVVRTKNGYRIFAQFSWSFLDMEKPVQGDTLDLSIAVHDIDNDQFGEKKLNWYFKNQDNKIKLGRLILE